MHYAFTRQLEKMTYSSKTKQRRDGVKKQHHQVEIDLNEEVKHVPGLKQMMEFESNLDNVWAKAGKRDADMNSTKPLADSPKKDGKDKEKKDGEEDEN